MSTFYSVYSPNGGGGGSGVSSLNGMTGALTLVAGSNITITPGSGTLTISSTSSGSSALSSITAATAANSINNADFLQTWSWNTLSTGKGLLLNSNQNFSGNILSLESTGLSASGPILNLASASTTGQTGILISLNGASGAGVGLNVLNNNNNGTAAIFKNTGNNTNPVVKMVASQATAATNIDVLRLDYPNNSPVNNQSASIILALNRAGLVDTNIARISGQITDITSGAYKGALVFSTADNADPVERMRIDNVGQVTMSNYSTGAAIFDSSGNISSVAAGSMGNVLTSDGTTWISSPPSGLPNPVPNNTTLNWVNGTNNGLIPVLNVNVADSIIIGQGSAGPGIQVEANPPGGITLASNATSNGTISFLANLLDFKGDGSTGFSLRLWDTANSKHLDIQPPAAFSNDTAWVLPNGNGSSGQVLTTDGATPTATLSWTTVSGGSGLPADFIATNAENTNDFGILPALMINSDTVGSPNAIAFGSSDSSAVRTSDVILTSGSQVNSTSGNTSGGVVVVSGSNTGTGQTGEVDILTGAQNGASGVSGNIVVQTGDALNGATGQITIGTGNSHGSNGNSGDLLIFTGFKAGTGTNGKIKLQPADHPTTTAGYVWTATATDGSGDWMPASGGAPSHFIFSNSYVTNLGGLSLTGPVLLVDSSQGDGQVVFGSSDIPTPTAGNIPAVFIASGDMLDSGSTGTVGGITIQVGQQNGTGADPGPLNIYGGKSANGTGSIVQIVAGISGGAGGANASMLGGDSLAASGIAGNAIIGGGVGAGTSGNTKGGNVYLQGGSAAQVGATGTGGDVNLTGGAGTSFNGNIVCNSGLQFPVRIVTGNDSPTYSDYILILNAASGTYSISLPPGKDGLTFYISKASTDAGTWNISPNGTDTLDFTGSPATMPLNIVFKSGVWYKVN